MTATTTNTSEIPNGRIMRSADILTIMQLKWYQCKGQDNGKKQSREEMHKQDTALIEKDG